MANTYKALSTVTVGAGGASSIEFTNIPQTYTDLKIVLSVRSDRAGVESTGFILSAYNNSAARNLTRRWLLGTGTSVGSSTASAVNTVQVASINAATSTANTFANYEMYIPNYASNVNSKPTAITSVYENNSATGLQFQTAVASNDNEPINSIKMTVVGGNFVQYSTATVYGVFNADVSSAPSTPSSGTATDSATSGQVSVAFTPVSNAASYAMTSSPGSITATGTTSPIVVSGLTNGTAYTFTCVSTNPFGSSAPSAASNSATPTAGYSSIATVSYPSGTGGDVLFTNIPSIYRTLQIRMFSRHTRVDNSSTWFITFNEDGGTNYSYQGAEQTGSSSISSVDNINQTSIQGPTSAANTGASRFGSAVINIFDANQTNKFNTMSYQSGFSNNGNGGARLWTAAATWRSTSAITTIRIAPNTGFAQYSHIALYGIG
jgi:hypothetical protein